MNRIFWQQESFLWGAALIILFPLLTIALGEAILWLERHHPSWTGSVRAVRNLLLPSLAVLVLLNKIFGLPGDRLPVQIVETTVGVFAILVLVSFVNTLLFGRVKVGTWQNKVPKLLRDLARFFLILMGSALVLSLVWQADLGGLFAALGVGSIVLGLALQDTLGNLFSGIALLFERPFSLGDWLEFSGTTGKVIEINWRSVHILTRELELLIIPNAVLSKEILRNYHLPQKLHVEPVDIGFSYDDPPNKVKRVLKEAALATTGVLANPEPVIQTILYNDFSIDYRVRLFLTDYDKVPQIRDEFLTSIWYTANRHNLNIPFPIRTVYHQPPKKDKQDDILHQFVEYLRTFPTFAVVDRQTLSELARDAKLEHFGKGEWAIAPDTVSKGLYLVIAGTATVALRDDTGIEREITRVTRGEFFGETALMVGQAHFATIVTALSDLEVLILNTETLQTVLDRVPRLAQEIGAVIETRRQTMELLRRGDRNGNSEVVSG